MEVENTALEKQVRAKTSRLEVREEDLDNKEVGRE